MFKLDVWTPPTMSKSALLMSPCRTWAHPSARRYNETLIDATDTSKRDLGIKFHDIMDHAVRGLYLESPPELAGHVGHAEAYLEGLRERFQTVTSEVAVGLNWVTGEAETGDWPNRKYPYRDGFMYGSADLVCFNPEELYVGDWKTGGVDGAEEQLMSLACALNVLHPGRQVIISCLQVNEHGVWPKERQVSETELGAHADSLRFQWEDLEKASDPVIGVQCTALYCTHLAYCPAVSEAVVCLAQDGQKKETVEPMAQLNGVLALTDLPASNAEAGNVMAALAAAKRQAKYLEASLKAYIANGGRVTAGQYEWGPGGNGYRWRKES